MFDIYIKDFNQNGTIVAKETLVQSIPSSTQSDIKLLNPTLKVEMGNAEQFNFSIEGGTKFYDSFNQMKTFMRVVYDGDTIFYGRVLTIDNDFFGNRKIRLEGSLAFLNDTSMEGKKEEARVKQTVNKYLNTIIDNHNTMCKDSKRSFELGEVPGNYSDSISSAQRLPNESRKFGQDGWSDCKGLIEDLRSHYGGYLRVRCLGYKDGTRFVDQGHYIDWLNHYFNKNLNPQTIEVGKNVLDISRSTEIDNIFTVVIPIGNSKSTSYETADGQSRSTGPRHFYVDGYEVTVPSICEVYGTKLNSGYHTYEDYEQALNRYGRIIKTVTFDDAETPSQLLTKCQKWIKDNYQGEVTNFTIKAIDMHMLYNVDSSGTKISLEDTTKSGAVGTDKGISVSSSDTTVLIPSKIMVGDRVKIIYPQIKEDGSIEKVSIIRTCLSINYDLYNPENTSYTFGIPANILTKSYGLTKQSKSTNSPSTTPNNSGGGGNTGTRDWLDQVIDWLAHHKVCYKHVASYMPDNASIQFDPETGKDNKRFPYTESYKSYMKGPYSEERKNYFLDTESVSGVGRFALWQFKPNGTAQNINEQELDRILLNIEQSMVGAPSTAIEQAKKAAKDSYNRSRTYTAYKGERVYLSGDIPTEQQIIESNVIQYVYQEYGFNLKKFNNVSMPSITYTDANGIENNIEGNTEPGGIVTSDMIRRGKSDDDPSFHVVMTSDNRAVGAIEVEETDMYGIKRKVWKYFEVDPDDPNNVVATSIRDLTLTKLDSDKVFGSMIKEKWMDEDGEHVSTYRLCQAIEEYKNGEMVVVRVEGDVAYFGYGDQNNPNQSYYTSVASLQHLDSVAGAVHFEPDENGVQTLVLDHAGGVRVRRGKRDPETGEWIKDDEGNLVLAEFGVYDDNNLTGGIVAEKLGDGTVKTTISGDIIDIKASNLAKFGLVDENGNLTGGMITEKLKDGTVSTKISGDIIDITAANLAQFGLVNEDGELTGGMIVEKLDDGTVTTKISSDIIYLKGETLADTMYSCDLSAQSFLSYSKLVVGKNLDFDTDAYIRYGIGDYNKNLGMVTFTPINDNSVEYAKNLLVNAYITNNFLYMKHLDSNYLTFNFNDTNHTLTITDKDDHKITFRSYVGGWDAATSSTNLVIPMDKVNLDSPYANEITITYPSSTVDLYSTLRYYMDENGPDDVSLIADISSTNKVQVANYHHNRYTLGKKSGWNSATSSTHLNVPKDKNSDTNKQDEITLTYPTTYEAHSELRYYLDEDGGGDAVSLIAELSSTNKKPVATFNHNRYTLGKKSGWNSATSSTHLNVPKDKNSDTNKQDEITLTYPTTYEAHSTLRYYLIEDSGDAVSLIAELSSNNKKPVATINHNRYTLGKNSVNAAAPTYSAGPEAFAQKTTITVYSNTETKKQKSGTITLSKGTYAIGTSGTTNHCVNLKNGSTLIGLISTESVYTDGRNSIINAGGAISRTSNVSNEVINKYVTTLTIDVPTSNATRIGGSDDYFSYAYAHVSNGYYTHQFSLTNRRTSGYVSESGGYYLYYVKK